MMTENLQSHRRQFLRGLGACVALPALEVLGGSKAWAETVVTPTGEAAGAPLRMAYVYVPNGVNVAQWRPNGVGTDYQLGPSLEALAPLREHFQLISGLEHRNGTAGPDGAGDHARANSSFLTGARPKKTAGADLQVGVSVDQLAARHVGRATRFPSLELSCDGVRNSGACDSGYSCAYQFNLSWRSVSTPMSPEANPRLVFERLFGAGGRAERHQNMVQRQALQQSILDFVSDDAKRLQRRLGRNDQLKLDEYLTGVRDIEHRIQRAEDSASLPNPDMETPAGIPDNYKDHVRLMYDLLVLAFQTDSTRIATFLLAHDGSNRSFREIEVSEGHHYLSHHKNNDVMLEKIAKIDCFYVEQLTYFLHKMEATKDVDGNSLLENSMIVYGSGLADGNRHQHDQLPVLLAGHGGGLLTPGRHVDLGTNTPMCNLYLSMLRQMGVQAERFGDSTGHVAI